MDDVFVRSRYPRHNTPNRRKKKYSKEDNTLVEKITWQLVAAIVILVIIVVIKSINTPVTNYLTEKVKAVVIENIDLKSLYQGIDSLFGKENKEKINNTDDSVFDEAVLPASTDLYKPEGTEVETADGDGYSTAEDSNQILDGSESIIGEIIKKYNFITPTEGILSSPFGERTDPKTKELKFHKGIDIDTDNSSGIKAALDGVVIEAGSERTYGNYIKIKHDDGLTTVYAHCSQLIAKKEQKVKQGDVIAKVGDTGASVGSHLHFEIWINGKAADPLKFISVPLE